MHIVAMFFFLLSMGLSMPPPQGRKRLWLCAGGLSLAVSSAITYAAVIVCFGGLLVVVWERFRRSPATWLSDSLTFSAPWGIWMVSWLSVVWVVTSPMWADPPSPAAVTETEIEEQAETDSEKEREAESDSSVKRPIPLLDPYFYRESIADTWNDRLLKVLVIACAFYFFFARGKGGCPERVSRLLFFAIPIASILILQPQQFYRRYLLSLFPFAMIGVGALGALLSRRIWMGFLFGIGLALLNVAPVIWVLSHSPQPWKSATTYLNENMAPGDQLFMGSHQAEFGASYYMVGKVPTWEIVYYSMIGERFIERTEERGTSWFVQWYGLPPETEEWVLEYYDKVRVFPGRFGTIMIYREKPQVDEEEEERENF